MKQMTETERRLLAALLENDEDEGNKELYRYQQEALRQLRVLMDYLQEKYPETRTDYHYFEPLTKNAEHALLVCSLKNSETMHKAILRRGAKGEVCRDDLYSDLVCQRYDKALAEELQPLEGLKLVRTSFLSLCNKDIDGSSTVKEINAYRPRLRRHTDLFITDGTDLSSIDKKRLEEKGFYGSYTVYLVDQDWQCPEDLLDLYSDAEAGVYFGITGHAREDL